MNSSSSPISISSHSDCSSDKRINTLCRHLNYNSKSLELIQLSNTSSTVMTTSSNGSSNSSSSKYSSDHDDDYHYDENSNLNFEGIVSMDNIEERIPDVVKRALSRATWDVPDLEVFRNIPGPHTTGGVDPVDAIKEIILYQQQGKDIIGKQIFTLRYGGSMSTNIVVPAISFATSEMTNLVLVNDPRDAQRLARFHLKKSKLYGTTFLGDGILSTQDMNLWKKQRNHLSESFLPLSSLRKICPASVDRARFSVEKKLVEETQNGLLPININEFFLFEAMAQLQCVFMGIDNDFMESNNVKLRKAFATLFEGAAYHSREELIEAWRFIKWHSDEILKQDVNAHGCPRFAAPSDAMMRGCPVHGPLSARLNDAHGTHSQKRDNQTTLSFAGFDTTANKMTWFTFEMARRPELQKRLHDEIDEVVRSLHGRDLSYDDLSKLPTMSAFLRETLRLWPSVANGTFRELITDDTVYGKNNELITIPKGTSLHITAWMLHHNPELWDNPWEFQPDREWLPEEKWHGKAFSGQTPESHRYAPFTFTGRECIGKNFAHMEARVILFHLFKDFEVSLAEPTASIVGPDPKRFPVELVNNMGTLGPAGGLYCTLARRFPKKMV